MRAFKAALTTLIACCIALLITAAAMPKLLLFYDRSAWLAILTILAAFFIILRFGIGEIGFGRFIPGKQKAGERSTRELQHNGTVNLEAYAEAALKQFKARFSKKSIKPFLSAILDPLGSTVRVSEQIQVERGVLRVTTSKTVYTDADTELGEQIFPILRVGKAALVDRLEVTVDDKPAKTLTHIETVGAILMVLRSLYTKLFKALPANDADVKAFANIYALACDSTPRQPPDIQPLLTTVSNLRNKVTGLSDNDPSLIALLSLIRFLGDSSFILVSVPSSGSRVRLRVKYYQRQREFYRKIRDRFRVACGLEIRGYYLPMQAAVEAPSYHLTAQAPEGMYLHDARFHLHSLQSRWRTSADPRFLRSQAPRAEISDTYGLGYVHVYVRDIQGRLAGLLDPLGQTNVSDHQVALGLDVEFREIPPGLLLPVLMFSTLFLALTLLLGHFHDDVFAATAPPVVTSASASPTATPSLKPSSAGTVGPSGSAGQQRPVRSSQAPTAPSSSASQPATGVESPSGTGLTNLTVLFAIPALLAGWVISRLDSATVRRISLATALLTFWFIFNTGAAVFLVGFKGIQHHPTTIPFVVGVISHVSWAGLSLSAAANTTAILTVLLNRAIRYSRRLRRGRSVIAP